MSERSWKRSEIDDGGGVDPERAGLIHRAVRAMVRPSFEPALLDQIPRSQFTVGGHLLPNPRLVASEFFRH